MTAAVRPVSALAHDFRASSSRLSLSTSHEARSGACETNDRLDGCHKRVRRDDHFVAPSDPETPAASSSRASVPFAMPTAWAVPQYAAHSSSKRSTSSPPMKCPLRHGVVPDPIEVRPEVRRRRCQIREGHRFECCRRQTVSSSALPRGRAASLSRRYGTGRPTRREISAASSDLDDGDSVVDVGRRPLAGRHTSRELTILDEQRLLEREEGRLDVADPIRHRHLRERRQVGGQHDALVVDAHALVRREVVVHRHLRAADDRRAAHLRGSSQLTWMNAVTLGWS